MALLAEHGQKQEVLDPNELAKLDPVFEPVKSKIAGAVRDLGDSSGDSRLFVENLARSCQDKLGRDREARRARDGARGQRRPDRRGGDQSRNADRRQLRPRARCRQPGSSREPWA